MIVASTDLTWGSFKTSLSLKSSDVVATIQQWRRCHYRAVTWLSLYNSDVWQFVSRRELCLPQTCATKTGLRSGPAGPRDPKRHRYDSTCSSPNWSVKVRDMLGTRPRNTVIPFMLDIRSRSVTQLPVPARISLPVVRIPGSGFEPDLSPRDEFDLECRPSVLVTTGSELCCKFIVRSAK